MLWSSKIANNYKTWELMEEMSPALAMTLSLGNSMCDNSGIASHVEITRLKIVTETASMLSVPVKVVSEDSLSGGGGSCSHAMNELNLTTLSTLDDGGIGKTFVLNMLLEKGNGSIASDAEDEVFSDVEDRNGIITKELLVLDAGSEISLPKSVEMENTKIIAKTIIVESTNEEQASAVFLKFPSKKNLIGGPTRSVFELDCVPLWGSVSICGRRLEMEDAVAAFPRFAKVPIKMLIGVSCRLLIIVVIKSIWPWLKRLKTLKTIRMLGLFGEISRCNGRKPSLVAIIIAIIRFGGKSVRGIIKGDENASIARFEPVAPKTVGSTAGYRWSVHIMVANCGDSRAVLCGGKESMALSVGHQR
ncbi:hypothetical protein NC651_002059 [Populus alba x Populus x berolinensis]|nr:hypothetical protein NC651_002059 [Populus alba x Populus x berolinensis]